MSGSAAAAVALAAVATALGVPAPSATVRRARRIVRPARRPGTASPRSAPGTRPAHGSRDSPLPGGAARAALVPALAALGALGLGLTVVGGPSGVVVGAVAGAVVVAVLRRAEPAADRAARERRSAELPAVAELVAACLDCGAAPTDAVRSVAEAFGSPWRDLLIPPLAAIALGADPRGAWCELAADDAVAPLADVLARGADDGVALVPLLHALASDRRRERRAAARRRAQRVGVLALGPLAACFLPAFVVVGVVPVVVSVGRSVLGGLL